MMSILEKCSDQRMITPRGREKGVYVRESLLRVKKDKRYLNTDSAPKARERYCCGSKYLIEMTSAKLCRGKLRMQTIGRGRGVLLQRQDKGSATAAKVGERHCCRST